MSALPAETMVANGTESVSWRHCEVHTRSTFNILSLCLSTLVICIWNAVHPGVPFPEHPRWRVYLTRLYGFLVGLFLPEVLVLTALYEFVCARMLLQEINGTEPESIFTISYFMQLLREMYPRVFTISYWTEDYHDLRQPERPHWSMAHAFYAVMGGFVARSSSGQVTTLGPETILYLWEYDSSMPLLLAGDGIEDHSKAGALAKALFCWQLLVFAINCAARRAEHLPLSLLEITTLAHSLCGLAAFALWWHKPHSVEKVVVIPIDDSIENIEWDGGPSDATVLHGVNVFDTTTRENLTKAALASLAVASLYGFPHLLALSTDFPTLVERRCWQVATGIIIGTPLITVAIAWASHRVPSRFEGTLEIIFMGLIIIYSLASCFIVAESLRQLFALPSGAFLSPEFICYLPHFS